MLNKLKNQKGIMLPDIIASLPLGVIVLTVMTLAILNYINAYSDLRDYTKLQDDLFQAVETIRYGYVQRGINTNGQSLCGILSANRVSVDNNGNALNLVVDTESSYEIRTNVTLSNGSLNLRGSYGATIFSSPNSSSNNITIFPDDSSKINGQKKYQIINSNSVFTSRKQDSNGNVRLLEINLEARVRFRERINGQSADDDIRINTRTIRYKTNVFVGNTSNTTT